MWRWAFQMLRNCTATRYAINKQRMVVLAEYSRDCLRDLRSDIGIEYDERSRGTLQLFRKPSQLDAVASDINVLRRYGVPYEVLNRGGCIAVEPGLAASAEKIAGGLRLPDDETGDCYLFTKRLEAHAAALGARFVYNTNVESFETFEGRVVSVLTDKDSYKADKYVVALGCFSPILLRPLRVDFPVYPVKGYSITVPVTHDAAAPQSTVMDETNKVAITRLGDRIRVGGTAEVGGYQINLVPARRTPLIQSLTELFPNSCDLSAPQFWSGLRPMTPDGPPIIGPTSLTNLYLNTGHGTLGWTMACGSGRVLADLLVGRTPDVPVEGLSIDRCNRGVSAC
jgi:D-amino-acid dehydrogenase